MKWISFILLGSLTATFAFVALLALYDGAKHLRSWRGPVRILVGVLGLLGTAGFMGAAFASLGGLDWLGSFEWPIGHASGVVRLADGTYVVPHTPTGRIQLYDSQRHFIRAWRIDGGGGRFTVLATDDDTIEVYTARSYWHLIYDSAGHLLSKSKYDYRSTQSLLDEPQNAQSIFIPTSPFLWPLTGPFYAWLSLIGALGLWKLCDRGSRRRRK